MENDLFTVIRVGGLGLYSAIEVVLYIFVNSRDQSWMLQDYNILRDSGIYGIDFNFNIALDGLSVTIPDFDLSNFTSKGIFPPKAQHDLISALFSISVQHMDVKFEITARQKVVFGCLQISHV